MVLYNRCSFVSYTCLFYGIVVGCVVGPGTVDSDGTILPKALCFSHLIQLSCCTNYAYCVLPVASVFNTDTACYHGLKLTRAS